MHLIIAAKWVTFYNMELYEAHFFAHTNTRTRPHMHNQTLVVKLMSTWWAAVLKKEVKAQSICFNRKSTEATYRRADVN